MTEEQNNTTKPFTVAIIALLISIGVPVADRTYDSVFSGELNNYFICNKDLNILEFPGGVSSTGYSGYPYENSRKGVIYCGTSDDKGAWVRLTEYASSIGIDPYDLLQQPTSTEPQEIATISNIGTSWECGDGCNRIR